MSTCKEIKTTLIKYEHTCDYCEKTFLSNDKHDTLIENHERLCKQQTECTHGNCRYQLMIFPGDFYENGDHEPGYFLVTRVCQYCSKGTQYDLMEIFEGADERDDPCVKALFNFVDEYVKKGNELAAETMAEIVNQGGIKIVEAER